MPFRTDNAPRHPAAKTRWGRFTLFSALVLVLGLTVSACASTTPDPDPDPDPIEFTLSSISPATGDFETRVTIVGTGIAGDATVTVGGVAATAVVVRDADGLELDATSESVGTRLSFNPPVLADGAYDVAVTSDGATETLADAFTYEEVLVDPGAFAVRLNAGGPEVETADGNVWLADADTGWLFAQGAAFTENNALLTVDVSAADATEESIYRSERNTGTADVDAQFTYFIPVPEPGTYELRLHFAEIFYGTLGNPGGEGSRLFDVGTRNSGAEDPVFTLVDYDIVLEAGASATAVVEVWNVTVTGESLGLVFQNGSADRAKVSAIEVLEIVATE